MIGIMILGLPEFVELATGCRLASIRLGVPSMGALYCRCAGAAAVPETATTAADVAASTIEVPSEA